MSSWDEKVFADENGADFLRECDDLDDLDVIQAIHDACTVALNHAAIGEPDHATGLCAATIAAIWSGAPFTATLVADEHPIIRARIGSCPESLKEVAIQLLDGYLETRGDETPDGLETCVEALS